VRLGRRQGVERLYVMVRYYEPMQRLMTCRIAIVNQMHFMPAGELQGDIITVKPRDLTRIFALELSIDTHNARISNGKF